MKSAKMSTQALLCFVLVIGLIIPTQLVGASSAAAPARDDRSFMHSVIYMPSSLSLVTVNAPQGPVTPMVTAGHSHTVGLKSDGTVIAVGLNHYGQCNVGGWTGIVQIAAGHSHTVGLKSDGTVIAVGLNHYGQCNVGDWTDILQVAAGVYHTVGLRADGTVVAVGYDAQGQCYVGNWTGIVQVAAGYFHTVGLKSDGTVVAVGSNSLGRCSVGDWTDIVQVAAGYHHTVGLRSDGSVVAVGAGDGFGGHPHYGQCSVADWTDILQVAAGEHHTVGLKSDGTVVAVGMDSSGRCDVGTWTDIVQVAAGDLHTVALKSDGTVIAVGMNEFGQCNVGTWTDILQVAGGVLHTVGVKSDGTVIAVGMNEYGQGDLGTWTDIVQVSAGRYHTVGLKSDGSVVAMGAGDNATAWPHYGQCSVTDWADIVQVSAGYHHTVGLKSDGTVVAVGLNSFGQCDLGAWTDMVQVAAGGHQTVGLKSDGTVMAVGCVGWADYGQCNVDIWTDIVQVAEGSYHTVGLKSDGTVVAVGRNNYGQCNVGTWTDIVQVAAGDLHTVGLKSDGTLVAMGVNSVGQCNVGIWTDILQVAAGHRHTVGLKSDGTVVAVGRNDYGQCNVGMMLLQIPRLWHSPRGFTAPPVDAVALHFRAEMDTSSFSIIDDISSFAGPSGNITVTGFSWTDSRTLELSFEPQWAAGSYEMCVGPDITDVSGNPMDDMYLATFVIRAPAVVRHSPSGYVGAPVEALRFSFSHAMDTTSFSVIEDIVSFTGPDGTITATGFDWLDSETLEVTFASQYTLGVYEMVVGPHILDLGGNAMDQNKNLIPGEWPDDLYTASFTITAPKIVAADPHGIAVPPVSSVRFDFDLPMDTTSFSIAYDIARFTGPDGDIAVTGFSWLDSETLEVTFDPQYKSGAYEMVVGPHIMDLAGNAMDQNCNLIPGEIPDDQYVATFTLAYSGTLTDDTSWGPEHGVIALDGELTIASGVSLTIEAGTIVKFSGGSSRIRVYGDLNVFGTPAERVILTSFLDDTAGGDTNGDGGATVPQAGSWQGLRFESNATGTLTGVEVRYANTAIDANANYADVQLHNAVLRNNVRGIHVWSPLARIVATNCLMANNRQEAIFMRASSHGTFRNCTIVGNGFHGGYNAAIHMGAATLIFDNCIVAFNRNGINHTNADPGDATVRNSVFYNPDGQNLVWGTSAPMPNLGENGNMESDPRFVNREAGDYELDAGSSCIDAGRGFGALAKDILGRPRYDDRGMPNVGYGFPSYVDIGAFERQEDTAAGDLAVTYVSAPAPAFVNAGDSFTVEWTITNVGLTDCAGNWVDRVYLSTDPYLSADDILLEERTYTGELSSGASYTETLTAVAPAITGPRYVIVHTNAERSIFDPVEANNVRASAGVLGVNVPILTLETPVTGTVAHRQWSYIRFDAQAGSTILLDLSCAVSSGSVGLYIRYGLPPTLNAYDAVAALPYSSDQELRIISPLEGTYYVGIYGTHVPGGSAGYTVSAQLTALRIHSVYPNSVGNAGDATLQIEGDNFSFDDEICLIAPDGVTQIEPTTVHYHDSALIFATFDLTGAGEGAYDVVLTTAQDDVVTLPTSVTVTDGGGPEFQASLSMPGMSRPGRVITIRVDYSNRGTNDLLSPLLTLSSPDDCQWQLPGSTDWVSGTKLRLMALSSSGPANILRAGQSESIEVKVRTPFRPGSFQIFLHSLGARPGDGSDDTIDWSAWYSDEAMIAEMELALGTTWREYIERLGEAAAAIAQWKGPDYSAVEMEYYALLHVGTVVPNSSNETDPGSEGLGTQATGSTATTVYQWNSGDNRWDPASGTKSGTTAVLIHGWIHPLSAIWWSGGNPMDEKDYRDLAIALTHQVDNILGVCWDSRSVLPSTSAARIPGVSLEAYELLSALQIDPGETRLIGHSHGAHVAGMIGTYFKQRSAQTIKRITALDPSDEAVHKSWMGWGMFSAEFVDSYKSSILAGGETNWGHHNFLVVEDGYTYDGRRPIASHDYARTWYTDTISSHAAGFGGSLGLGYGWETTESWTKAKESLAAFGGQRGNWIGLIRGVFDDGKNLSTLECFSEGTDLNRYTEEWHYPGAWWGGSNDSAAIKGMERDLAGAVEMEVGSVWIASAEGTVDESGISVWKAAGKGSIFYTVENHADNRSIRGSLRKHEQMGQGGLLSGRGIGPIVDTIWLSRKSTLCEKPYPLETVAHKDYQFLGIDGVDNEHHERHFIVETNLPGQKEILEWWGASELQEVYYIIVDAGSTKTDDYPTIARAHRLPAPYPGELYPENNLRAVPVIIQGEGLSANAGPPQTLYDHDCTGWVTVTLDGSGSAPKELIDSYEWSVGVSGKTVECSLPIGTHTITLTVSSTASGKDDTAEVVITVEPNREPQDGDEEDSGSTNLLISVTPEDKFGPAGHDAPDVEPGHEQRFIRPGQVMEYRIEFWNDEDAVVPTQDAVIYDVLDPAVFDLSTLELTRIGFLAWNMPLPGGQSIDMRVDCQPEMNIAVEVRAGWEMEVFGLDDPTGKLIWWFHTIDPVTGDYPDDPMAGFLPPFNPQTEYELGWVEFRVKAWDNLPTGTRIENQALVQFDFMPNPNTGEEWGLAPPEGPWINTIDAGRPTSQINELPEAVSPTFEVSWSGQDDEGGSGIAAYDIFVRKNNGTWSRWLRNTPETSAHFEGEPGHAYCFYSIATDNVGNREDKPAVPEASTTTTTAPVVLVINTTLLPAGQVGAAYEANLHADGGTEPYAWEATGLPNGLSCPEDGVISGTPIGEVGEFIVTVTVSDAMTNTHSRELPLTISCMLGDANMDGVVNAGDLTKVRRIYFELDPPTPCADVNGDGVVNSGDLTAIRMVYFGLMQTDG